MNNTRSFLLAGLLIGAASATGVYSYLASQSSTAAAASGTSTMRNLRIAHGLPTIHPVHEGIVRFSERLHALSGGAITSEVFPAEQLGNETECLEKVSNGTLDLTKVSTAPIANFVPVMKVFSLPYLFDDSDHYWRVLDSPIGKELLDEVEKTESGTPSGFVGLCYFDSGSRNFYAKTPILSPADIRDKTVRVMQDPVAIEMIKVMGGNPFPMGFGELYSALQTGNVDAAENNPPSFVSSRHLEVCKEFSFDHHSRIPDLFLVSQSLWNTLSDQEKEWFHAAADDASRHQRELWKIGTEESIATMRENGVTIHEPDLEPFRDATAEVTRMFAKGRIGDYVKRIGETN